MSNGIFGGNASKDGCETNINDGKQVGETIAGRYTFAYNNDNVSVTLMMEYEDRQGPPRFIRYLMPMIPPPSFSTDVRRIQFRCAIRSASG